MPHFFGPDEYLTTPMHIDGPAVTMLIWVKWESGMGPLVKTADEAWAFPYDHDGSCAFRAGGEGQVTSMPVSEVRGRWVFYALAADDQGAVLWIDDGPADVWNGSPPKQQEADLIAMQDAVGHAADFAVFDKRLSNERLGELWTAGKNDPDLLA